MLEGYVGLNEKICGTFQSSTQTFTETVDFSWDDNCAGLVCDVEHSVRCHFETIIRLDFYEGSWCCSIIFNHLQEFELGWGFRRWGRISGKMVKEGNSRKPLQFATRPVPYSNHGVMNWDGYTASNQPTTERQCQIIVSIWFFYRK